MYDIVGSFKTKLLNTTIAKDIIEDADIDICRDRNGIYNLMIKEIPDSILYQILETWEQFKKQNGLHYPDGLDRNTKPCEEP